MGQFKTDLTLAELEVLISGSLLNIGLQYYVTDKDWLLYATSVNTLKPVNGSLHIFNGETLPTGIEPDVLLIDTGIVDWDTVTTPLIISPIINYDEIPIVIIKEISSLGGIMFIGMCDGDTFSDVVISNKYRTICTSSLKNKLGEDIIIYEQGESHTEGFSFRATLEFHRSELSFPIPVPHIVSAETQIGNDSKIIIQTDSFFKLESTDGLLVKVDNSEVDIEYFINDETDNSKLIIGKLDTPFEYGTIYFSPYDAWSTVYAETTTTTTTHA